MLSIISSSLVKIRESFLYWSIDSRSYISIIFQYKNDSFYLARAIPLVEMLWYNNFLYESNTIYFVKIYNKPHGTKPSRMPYMYCDRWQLVKISRSWALLEKLEYKAFNKYINRAVNTKYYDVIILFKYVFSVFFAWRFSTTRKHFINVFYELVSW